MIPNAFAIQNVCPSIRLSGRPLVRQSVTLVNQDAEIRFTLNVSNFLRPDFTMLSLGVPGFN